MDDTAPTILLQANEVTSNSIRVVANATDDESGISSYEFSIDGGSYIKQTTNTYTFGQLKKNTSHTIKVRVTNGNNMTTEASITATTKNFGAPTITSSPSWTTWSKNKTITITYPTRQSNFIFEYSIDGCSTWKTVTTGNTYSFTLTANGTIVARVRDGYDPNTAQSVSYTVTTVDTTKPSVPTGIIRKDSSTGDTVTNEDKWTNQTLWWGEFTATDNGEIDHYEYSTGCTGTKSGDLSDSYTYSSEMEQKYCIRAVDKAGNIGDWSTPYYFKIDKTVPTLTYSIKNDTTGAEYTLGSWSKNGLYRYLYPADTGGSGVKEVQYYSSSTGWTKEENLDKYWIGETNSATKFRVLDNAGNYSNELTLTTRVDWTAPVITVGPRTNGDSPLKAGHVVHINIYYTDNMSGLNYRDITGNVTFPRTQFNGLMTTKGSNIDYLGLYNYGTISYSVTVCDVAGNCASKSGTA